MNSGSVKFRRLALSLTIAAVGLLPSCARSAANSHIGAAQSPTQVALPTATLSQAAPRTLEGRVVGVADGDTITVLGAGSRQARIRLQGIDAPESGQPFGQVSKRNLSDLIFDRRVTVEYEKTDRYGRILGKVLADGRDLNLEQVRAGLAWHYKYYQDEQTPEDRRLYANAETEARSARRGLWADANPTPPWDFRRGGRGRADDAEEAGPADGAGVPTPAPTPGRQRQSEGQKARASDQEGEAVYVTRTGSKYHRPGCQYLRRSRIPVSLKEAKQTYEPCSVCRPPR